MIRYPNIDPVLIRIGPLAIRWYGLMYLIGFISSYLLVRYQVVKKKIALSGDDIESLYSYLIFGLIIGARMGYVIFYNLGDYIKSPLEVFAVWHGGMSFHGGLAGAVIAGIIFCRKHGSDFWQLGDLIIVTAPIGLGLGRLGNFINGELFGRPTDLPWGMIFPSGGPFPRHPSQLYEFLLEGVILFAVLWSVKDKNLRSGTIISLFLILYGIFRFTVEFFREPDPQLGFIFGPFTMGQALSVATALFGAAIFFIRNKAKSAGS
jgi:phosphatidylglycerol:prolipoprotein diacylglycerol transferase